MWYKNVQYSESESMFMETMLTEDLPYLTGSAETMIKTPSVTMGDLFGTGYPDMVFGAAETSRTGTSQANNLEVVVKPLLYKNNGIANHASYTLKTGSESPFDSVEKTLYAPTGSMSDWSPFCMVYLVDINGILTYHKGLPIDSSFLYVCPGDNKLDLIMGSIKADKFGEISMWEGTGTSKKHANPPWSAPIVTWRVCRCSYPFLHNADR